MTTQNGPIVQVKRHFNAPPERVFDAWLDPARAGKWLFATPDGEMLQVDIEAKVGGHFLIVERRPGGDADHYGTYLEIDRPRRLVFLFTTERYSVEGDRVTIDFVAAGEGTDVTLTQEMQPKWAEYADRTAAGWTMILDSLSIQLDATSEIVSPEVDPKYSDFAERASRSVRNVIDAIGDALTPGGN